MSKKTSWRTIGRGSWCAVLGAMMFSACGGSDAERTSTEASQSSSPSVESEPADRAATADGPGWYACTTEGKTCSFVGTRMVRYGADGQYAYKSATKSIPCNSDVFGDPAPGVAKTCSISSTPSPYLQDAAQYTLTFRDEFSGTTLDASKWNDHIVHVPASDANDYGVSNGFLKIWPQADSTGEFKSRILTTYQKFSQAYGYFEMEAKLPVGRGLWPAFWLLNSDSPPGEPEIDIMEAYPGDDTGYWADSNHHPIRFEASFYEKGNGQENSTNGNKPLETVDLSAGFHKYAVKWEPNKVSYYFDGKLFYSADVSMSRPMYLLVDVQYGNNNPSGNVDSTTPLGPDNSLQVNYIRAWQLK